ncbi:Bro-N domain-containing protein [Chitinimonas sp.]|uniref:BRO-N domain-containing protein n=1 Tax=Chitinimonas sp. TaxID=1934313 RepID=UPI0035AE447F
MAKPIEGASAPEPSKKPAPSLHSFQSQSEGWNIRSLLIDGEPWFIAADVCRSLAIGNPSMALRTLDDDEKALSSIEGLSRGNDKANIINESGLYTLILRCRDAVKPGTTAHRFRKWVTGEVLPKIRRDGQFLSPTEEEARHAPRDNAWLVILGEDGNLKNYPIPLSGAIVDGPVFHAMAVDMYAMASRMAKLIYLEPADLAAVRDDTSTRS